MEVVCIFNVQNVCSIFTYSLDLMDSISLDTTVGECWEAKQKPVRYQNNA